MVQGSCSAGRYFVYCIYSQDFNHNLNLCITIHLAHFVKEYDFIRVLHDYVS